jgi:hypothetical protein
VLLQIAETTVAVLTAGDIKHIVLHALDGRRETVLRHHSRQREASRKLEHCHYLVTKFLQRFYHQLPQN